MPLILNGTTGVSGVDGSAGTPSYQGTDTNTGIFYPAADTIAFAEGGVESMRIDSSGNVGIGTSSPSFGLVVQKDNGSGYVAGFRSAAGSPMLTIQNTGGISQIQGLNSALSATADIALQVSGGNVGIGASSTGYKLQVSGTLGVESTGNNVVAGLATLFEESANRTRRNRLEIGGDASGAFLNATWSSGGTTAMRFQTDGTERMRITSAGDVGIGTTTPRSKLTLKADTSAATVAATPSIVLSNRSQTNSTFFAGGIFADFYRDATDPTYAGGIWFERVPTSANLSSNANIIFGVMANGSSSLPSERMRITVDGALLVGTSTTLSSTDAVHKIGDTGGSTAYARLMMQERSGNWISFNDGGGTHYGTISRSGGGVSYGSNSDYRLKENIAPMTGALAKVQQLKPCTYIWKTTGKQGDGFIAHELQEVCPDAVVGEKDAINPESDTPMYQQVDTSYLVATLTAAIQEQQAIITDLKQRIETLEAK